MVWWTSLVLCLDCFFFFVCISIIVCWFAFPLRFWYSSLYIYKAVLSCWPYNFKFNSHICTVLFLWLLFLQTYFPIDDFLLLLYVCFYQWAFQFVIFLFLVIPSPPHYPLIFCVCLGKFLCKAVFVLLNSLNFCLFVKLLIICQFWIKALLGRVFLVVALFPVFTLNIWCHSFLARRVSAQNSADNHMEFPLYIFPLCVICCFSLVIFNIFLCLLLLAWLICFSAYFSLGLSLCFLDLGDYFHSYVRKFFPIISQNISLGPLSFSSSSGTPIIWMLLCLVLCQRSLNLFSFFFFF